MEKSKNKTTRKKGQNESEASLANNKGGPQNADKKEASQAELLSVPEEHKLPSSPNCTPIRGPSSTSAQRHKHKLTEEEEHDIEKFFRKKPHNTEEVMTPSESDNSEAAKDLPIKEVPNPKTETVKKPPRKSAVKHNFPKFDDQELHDIEKFFVHSPRKSISRITIDETDSEEEHVARNKPQQISTSANKAAYKDKLTVQENNNAAHPALKTVPIPTVLVTKVERVSKKVVKKADSLSRPELAATEIEQLQINKAVLKDGQGSEKQESVVESDLSSSTLPTFPSSGESRSSGKPDMTWIIESSEGESGPSSVTTDMPETDSISVSGTEESSLKEIAGGNEVLSLNQEFSGISRLLSLVTMLGRLPFVIYKETDAFRCKRKPPKGQWDLYLLTCILGVALFMATFSVFLILSIKVEENAEDSYSQYANFEKLLFQKHWLHITVFLLTFIVALVGNVSVILYGNHISKYINDVGESLEDFQYKNASKGARTMKFVHLFITALDVVVLVAFFFTSDLGFQESVKFETILYLRWGLKEAFLHTFWMNIAVYVVLFFEIYVYFVARNHLLLIMVLCLAITNTAHGWNSKTTFLLGTSKPINISTLNTVSGGSDHLQEIMGRNWFLAAEYFDLQEMRGTRNDADTSYGVWLDLRTFLALSPSFLHLAFLALFTLRCKKFTPQNRAKSIKQFDMPLSYKTLLEQHLKITKLIEGISSCSTAVLFSYFSTRVLCICCELFRSSTAFLFDLTLKKVNGSEYISGNSGVRVKYDPTELESIVEIAYFLSTTLISLFVVISTISAVGVTVMHGFEPVRRYGLLLADSLKGRKFIMSLYMSFNAKKPHIVKPGSWFLVNKSLFLSIVGTALLLFSIMIQSTVVNLVETPIVLACPHDKTQLCVKESVLNSKTEDIQKHIDDNAGATFEIPKTSHIMPTMSARPTTETPSTMMPTMMPTTITSATIRTDNPTITTTEAPTTIRTTQSTPTTIRTTQSTPTTVKTTQSTPTTIRTTQSTPTTIRTTQSTPTTIRTTQSTPTTIKTTHKPTPTTIPPKPCPKGTETVKPTASLQEKTKLCGINCPLSRAYRMVPFAKNGKASLSTMKQGWTDTNEIVECLANPYKNFKTITAVYDCFGNCYNERDQLGRFAFSLSGKQKLRKHQLNVPDFSFEFECFSEKTDSVYFNPLEICGIPYAYTHMLYDYYTSNHNAPFAKATLIKMIKEFPNNYTFPVIKPKCDKKDFFSDPTQHSHLAVKVDVTHNQVKYSIWRLIPYSFVYDGAGLPIPFWWEGKIWFKPEHHFQDELPHQRRDRLLAHPYSHMDAFFTSRKFPNGTMDPSAISSFKMHDCFGNQLDEYDDCGGLPFWLFDGQILRKPRKIEVGKHKCWESWIPGYKCGVPGNSTELIEKFRPQRPKLWIRRRHKCEMIAGRRDAKSNFLFLQH
ncbi:Salivary glue protein Sgs-3 [Folsomia candida]|uniref:Salivary glue protein Sgs-3 n=1 Tax=Folsomia candida TaxID=158441 RepID=A0A226ECA5_FOLCA|nr:Salivary glue protein Sgs-3 [Folsomia candida]